MQADSAVFAKICSFDISALKWVPDDSPPSQISMRQPAGKSLRLYMGWEELPLSDVITVTHLAPCLVTLQAAKRGHVGLQFDEDATARTVYEELSRRKANYERFEQYEPSSVQSYFQYYAKLGNQQNMLQDSVRTGTYRRAILENPDDFRGATVMDIGAGSGILSFFSAQAGASVVYAVEASSMGEVIRELADTNNFNGSVIEVVNKPLESIRDEVDGKVDALVSEPIGTFLFNERMIETYLCARDRFLKPGGKMFPNVGILCIAPFSDAMLHWEQQNKNGFWKNTSFYGIDLTAALHRCTKEHFRQPVVDYVNPECLVSSCLRMRFDFTTVTIESLHKIDFPFDFEVQQPCLVHGMAGWFDILFEGSNKEVELSTAPWCPGTHWYQIRFLLEQPLAVNAGQHIEGTIKLQANNLQSYNVSLHMRIQGTNIYSEAPCIDLKDPEYRFYTSANTYYPPGVAGVWGTQGTQAQAGQGQPGQVQAGQGQAYTQAQAQQNQYNASQALNQMQQAQTNDVQAQSQPSAPQQVPQYGQYTQYGQQIDFQPSSQATSSPQPSSSSMQSMQGYGQPVPPVPQAVNNYPNLAVPPQQPWQSTDCGGGHDLSGGDSASAPPPAGGGAGYPRQQNGTRHRKKFRSPQNSARM